MDHNKKVVELPLEDVLPNRFQPRIKFNEESIIELSESIKEHGVIQPIVVRPVGDKYEIIAGERRYKASNMAGLTTIPALVTNFNDKESAEVALIENVQRKDLTPIEEAISYKKILDMGYLTQEQLATKLGKTQPTVANKLRLLNLDEDVQEALLEDKISERHARSLLKLNDFSLQKKLLNRIIEERLTVRKTDEEINNMLNGNYEENVIHEVNNQNLSTKNTFGEPVSFDFNIDQNVSSTESSSSDNFEIPKFEDLFTVEQIPNNQNDISLSNFEIPKFEDLFASQQSINIDPVSTVINKNEEEKFNPEFIVPKFDELTPVEEVANVETMSSEPNNVVEEKFNPEFIVPKFDELTPIEEVANVETMSSEPNDVVEEKFNPEFIVPKFDDLTSNEQKDNTENDSQIDYSANPFNSIFDKGVEDYNINLNAQSADKLEESTPFVFEDLFLNENNNLLKTEDLNNINYINESDNKNIYNEPAVMPFNFSNIDSLEKNYVKEEVTSHNTYVANDIKTVINTVHNCAETIKKYGFIVEVDENELPNEYKITFVIKK